MNPTIGLEFGTTYTFVQKDRTNYYHPLDISYFPDATHVGAELLEPGIAKGTNTDCATNKTCPAPMYFLNEGYLGTYSNIPEVAPITTNEHDFGLASYEDFFFTNLAAWTGYGTFSFKLNFDDESYVDSDIFYYCRIHQYMAGRIKLLKNGEPVQPRDQPPMYYQPDVPGDFDQLCGVSKNVIDDDAVVVVYVLENLDISFPYVYRSFRASVWTITNFLIPNVPASLCVIQSNACRILRPVLMP